MKIQVSTNSLLALTEITKKVYLRDLARPAYYASVSNMHLNLKSNKSKPHGYEESFRPIDPRWSSTPVLGKYSAFKQHHKDKLHSAADSQNKFHSTLLLEVWLLCGTINAQDKQARLTVSSARKFILTSNLNQALFNTWVEVSKWHIKSPKYCQCACSILFLQSYIDSWEHTSTASTCKL